MALIYLPYIIILLYRYLCQYEREQVNTVVDFILKGCSFHIAFAITTAVKRVSVDDREELRQLLVTFFHSATEEELENNSKAIVKFYPVFEKWFMIFYFQ